MKRSACLILALLLTPFSVLRAETGAEGWLRYSAQQVSSEWERQSLPLQFVLPHNTALAENAARELSRAVPTLKRASRLRGRAVFVLTKAEARSYFPELRAHLPKGDGFLLKTV